MNHQENLQSIADIKKIMERSSRFISLSGKSGIAAGLCALVGASLAYYFISDYYGSYDTNYLHPSNLLYQLIAVAIGTFISALITAFFFTYLKCKKDNVPLFGMGSKKLAWNTLLPMIVGGLCILQFIVDNAYSYIAPASLIFYGLGLVNGSKYTLGEIRYLGYINIFLGLCNFIFPKYSIFFWALGFGVAHIFYGIAMWLKYDNNK
jgi:hypothetical protein